MTIDRGTDTETTDVVELGFQSRYAVFTEEMAEVLKAAHAAGEDLAVASGLDDETAQLLLFETLEAEVVVQRIQEVLASRKTFEPFTDYKRAVLAEIMFGIADLARELGEPEEEASTWWAAAMALLQAVADSPTASPLLWYDSIYRDLALAVRNGTAEQVAQAIHWLKVALAFNIRYYDGIHVLEHLSDLAKTYAIAGRYDDALRVYTGLLRNDPTDVWLYRDVAVVLGPLGFCDAGIAAAERGLALLETTVDEPELRRELRDTRDLLLASRPKAPCCPVSAARLGELRGALELGFDAGEGFDPIDVCRGLVPDIDTIPVKRQMRLDDLPASMVRAPKGRSRRHAGSTSSCGSADRLCWCGSGKLYKNCHMEADLASGRGGGHTTGKAC